MGNARTRRAAPEFRHGLLRNSSERSHLCRDDPKGKLRLMRHLSTYFALGAIAPAVLGAQARADLVLVNGRIYTVDNARPVTSALAVRGGHVLFVGSDAEA